MKIKCTELIIKYFKIPKTTIPSMVYFVVAMLLFLGIMPLQYGYYTILKIIVCALSSYLCYQIFSLEDSKELIF